MKGQIQDITETHIISTMRETHTIPNDGGKLQQLNLSYSHVVFHSTGPHHQNHIWSTLSQANQHETTFISPSLSHKSGITTSIKDNKKSIIPNDRLP